MMIREPSLLCPINRHFHAPWHVVHGWEMKEDSNLCLTSQNTKTRIANNSRWNYAEMTMEWCIPWFATVNILSNFSNVLALPMSIGCHFHAIYPWKSCYHHLAMWKCLSLHKTIAVLCVCICTSIWIRMWMANANMNEWMEKKMTTI